MQELMQVVANLKAQKEPSHTETILRRQSLMPLPKFGGSPKEWAFFKKTFDDTSEEGKFTDLENLTRLRQSLYGAALDNVRQLIMESENVKEIMKSLETAYGRPSLVYSELLADLHKLKKDSKTIVSDMVKALNNLVLAARLMNMPRYVEDHRKC
uniref:Uncharacterized protein n=1 Tax=Anopheles quadriannulatus TaxID=34691 RepID=A0A182WRW6_ANOQN